MLRTKSCLAHTEVLLNTFLSIAPLMNLITDWIEFSSKISMECAHLGIANRRAHKDVCVELAFGAISCDEDLQVESSLSDNSINDTRCINWK